LTGKKLLNGYLDQLRENVATLDETLALARKMGKSKKAGDHHATIQTLKLIRDLAEVRNATLLSIKAHILGRDETGTVKEPANVYSGNAQVMFERDFKRLLEPWTLEDLKLECEDCGAESEGVFSRSFEKQVSLGVGDIMTTETEHRDLCSRCYAKRTTKDTDESEEEPEASDPVPNLKEFAETQGEGNVNSTMNKTLTDLVRNTIRAVALGGSPREKVKELEEFKDHLITTAYSSHASGDNIEPGVTLLDKEIERLRAEAGKGQDAAGKPAT
jgi:uncharacterized small protein (DUF1192 family)